LRAKIVIDYRRPDIVVVDKCKQTALLIDIAGGLGWPTGRAGSIIGPKCLFSVGWVGYWVHKFTSQWVGLVSGAGTNLKVGVAPVRRESGGTRRKFFLGRAFPHFFALKVQLVVLVTAFVMVSTVWSVSCLLFFYSRCPRVQPCPMESAPLGWVKIDLRTACKISPYQRMPEWIRRSRKG